MNKNFYTKYDSRQRFRQHEKRISCNVNTVLFYHFRHEFHEIIRHNFQMKKERKSKHDNYTKNSSDRNKSH